MRDFREWRDSVLGREFQLFEAKPAPEQTQLPFEGFDALALEMQIAAHRHVAHFQNWLRQQAQDRCDVLEMRLRTVTRIAWALGGLLACAWAAVLLVLFRAFGAAR